MDKLTWYIIVMSMITFSVRYAFFSSKVTLKINEKATDFLSLTAPCILTAMWAPIVFGSIGSHSNLIQDPYLIAGVSTIIASLLIKNTLLLVVLSMSFFSLLKYLLHESSGR